VLRDIAIRREHKGYKKVEPIFVAFLNRIDFENLSLELRWKVTCEFERTEWGKHLDAWIDEWHAKQWDGKLRKAIITIPTNWTFEKPAFDTVRFEQVEALGRRLVEQDGVAAWGTFHYAGEFPTYGCSLLKRDLFMRSLVVDRGK
jgi:hypothetical protein